MPITGPKQLYMLHQDRICNILSQYKGPVDRVMLEEWIVNISQTLCTSMNSNFRDKFQKILRRGVKDVLHDQMVDHRHYVARPDVRSPARGHESNLSIEDQFDPPPSYISTALLPSSERPSTYILHGDTPPPYTPTVASPRGDRFANLPSFPDPESDIIFEPGTFNDFTPEEIIDHYRPAITRMVFKAMGY